MRNSFKVARWEMKRNMKNKSFIISLFLTPILFLIFSTLPSLLSNLQSDPEPVTVYIKDELHVMEQLTSQELNWDIREAAEEEPSILAELEQATNTVYIPLTDKVLEEGKIKLYMSEGVDSNFAQETRSLEYVIRQLQLEKLQLTDEEIALVSQGIGFEEIAIFAETEEGEENGVDPFTRIVPGVFAGLVLFSIVMTGMMIFQSASQEKKEKVAEIVLSSLTPGELMNGKIVGYFGLGMVQVLVWLLFAIPIVTWRFDFPVMNYLLVPELLLLMFIAFAGYLLFAAIFVSIGATVEDMTATSNFQGIVMMLPFLPVVLVGPVLADPSGLIAQIGSYFPITSPTILLLRLSILDVWPWLEIIISLLILLITIGFFMKLAGKIFKTGILLYGKNATPQEIWKWLRQ